MDKVIGQQIVEHRGGYLHARIDAGNRRGAKIIKAGRGKTEQNVGTPELIRRDGRSFVILQVQFTLHD